MGTGECVVVRFEFVLCDDDIRFGPKPRTMLWEVMSSALVSDPIVCDLTTLLPGLLIGAVDVDECDAR